MNARRLVLTAVALVAIAAPAGQAGNITADRDAAVRMASNAVGRDVLSAQRTAKVSKAVKSSALRKYPR